MNTQKLTQKHFHLIGDSVTSADGAAMVRTGGVASIGGQKPAALSHLAVWAGMGIRSSAVSFSQGTRRLPRGGRFKMLMVDSSLQPRICCIHIDFCVPLGSP